MNIPGVLAVMGYLCLVFGGLLLGPAGVGWLMDDRGQVLQTFLVAAGISAAVGSALRMKYHVVGRFGPAEGCASLWLGAQSP